MKQEAGRRERGRPRREEGPDPRLVLEAAVGAFARFGWDGANLRQVAAAAGVDTALIARRYDGKMGLWQAAVDHVSDQIRAALSPAFLQADHGDTPPWEIGVRDLVALSVRIPDLGRFFIDQIAQPGLRRDYVIAKMWSVYRDAITPLLAQAREAGALRPERSAGGHAAMLIGAIAMPLLMRSFALNDVETAAGQADFTQDVLSLFGLVPE